RPIAEPGLGPASVFRKAPSALEPGDRSVAFPERGLENVRRTFDLALAPNRPATESSPREPHWMSFPHREQLPACPPTPAGANRDPTDPRRRPPLPRISLRQDGNSHTTPA